MKKRTRTKLIRLEWPKRSKIIGGIGGGECVTSWTDKRRVCVVGAREAGSVRVCHRKSNKCVSLGE